MSLNRFLAATAVALELLGPRAALTQERPAAPVYGVLDGEPIPYTPHGPFGFKSEQVCKETGEILLSKQNNTGFLPVSWSCTKTAEDGSIVPLYPVLGFVQAQPNPHINEGPRGFPSMEACVNEGRALKEKNTGLIPAFWTCAATEQVKIVRVTMMALGPENTIPGFVEVCRLQRDAAPACPCP